MFQYGNTHAAFLPVHVRLLSRSHARNLHTCTSMTSPAPTYLSAKKAALIDAHLLSPPYCHTLPQLIELAGLSVAHAIAHFSPDRTAPVCLVCGPGNNGADALVAARHLFHFGYTVSVHYPIQPCRAPYIDLTRQLHALDIPISTALPLPSTSLIVDAIFGFSFNGDRPLSDTISNLFHAINDHSATVISIDVPSGWHVDKGCIYPLSITMPDALISLMAPKRSAALFQQTGRPHYVAGRFVPPALCKQLNFAVPHFPDTDDFVNIS